MKMRFLPIVLSLIVGLGLYCTPAKARDIWLGSPGYETLTDAVACIGQAPATLYVGKGVYQVDHNLDIPPNIALKVFYGAEILIGGNVTVTIRGPFTAGPFKIFTDNTSSLTKGVKFASSSKLLFVCPEWWGAVGNHLVDCAPAINQAINAAGLMSDKLHRIPVQFSAGIYMCNSTVNLLEGTVLRGVSVMHTTYVDNTVLELKQYSTCPLLAGNKADNICIEKLTLKNGGISSSGKLLYLYGGGARGSITGCYFFTSSYSQDGKSWALYVENHANLEVSGNFFFGKGGAYLRSPGAKFHHNEMTGNETGPIGVWLDGAIPIFSNNIIYLWHTGILLGAVKNFQVINDNIISQCVYAIRNSAARASVRLTGNRFGWNIYGYFCNCRTAKVTIEANCFMENPGGTPGSGNESVPTAAILVNSGRHSIMNNQFFDNTENITGGGKYQASHNLGIDVL